MTSFLERLGVQRQSFLALLRNYLRIDLRAQTYAQATNSKPGEAIPPLYWVVVQFLTVSALLAAILQARAPAGFYAATHLATTAALVFSAVLVEFHEAIINAEDIRVVGHRPVTDRTWALARLTNLASYVALMTLSLALFPTVMGAGLRDTSWQWLVCYPIAAVATALCATCAALALVGLAGTPLDGLRRIAAWLQILAILALFYGGQLMLRNASGDVELLALRPPTWFTWLPTSLLGEAVAHDQIGRVAAGATLALAFAFAAISWLASRWRSLTLVTTAPRRVEYRPPRQAGSLASAPWTWLGGTQRSQAITAFASRIYARDGELRMRVLSTIALPASAAALGLLTDQYAPPGHDQLGRQVMPIAFAVLLAAALVQGIVPWLTGRDHSATWPLRAVWDPAARRGVVRFILWRIYGPLWGAHALLLLWWWGDVGATMRYVLVGWALLECTAHLAARTLLSAPILRLPPRAGSGVGISPIVVAGASTAAAALGALWYLGAHVALGDLALGVILLVAARLVGRAR